jgi:hypothetical protein
MTPRRVAQLGFFLGLAAGALAYLAVGSHEIAFVCFVVTWYALGYGVPRATAHPEHRRAWLVHILLFPAAWIVAAAVLWLTLGNEVAAILLGAAFAVALQLLVTHVALRSVRRDQLHDLRHRLGIE